MESEQYAAPSSRRRVLARAGSLLAPALVLCAVVGVAGQVHRVVSASPNGFFSAQGPSGPDAAVPITLRIGVMLADPSTTAPLLAPAVAVLALAGLHLLRVRRAPVAEPVRRAGAVAAALVGAAGVALTVVVVGWVLVTHGSVGAGTAPAGTDTVDASLQLDPWDTLLGQGGTAVLAAVAGAGALLLLATAAPTGPGHPGWAVPELARAAAPAPAADPSPDPTPFPAPAEAPDERVTLATTPVADPALFRRPGAPATTGSAGAPDGYRRPPAGARDST